MAKSCKASKTNKRKSIRGTALLASLAIMLTVSACGEAKPYKPQATDTGSSKNITDPATANASPAKSEPVKTTQPSPTPAAQGQGANSSSSPSSAPATTAPTPTPTKPVADVSKPVTTTPVPASTATIVASATPTSAPITAPSATPEPKPTPSASPTPAPSEPAKTAGASADAEALFKASCIACHGDQLQGKSGPNLQKVGARKTKEQIITQINKGSTKMPGFEKSLDEASVEVLAAWLAEKK